MYKFVSEGSGSLRAYSLVWIVLSKTFAKVKNGDSIMNLYNYSTKIYMLAKGNNLEPLVKWEI